MSGPLRTDTPVLVATDVRVEYDGAEALAGFSLVVAPGETVALLGPSGSGKTTMLYATAGFLSLAEGSIELAGEVVSTPGTEVPPERRPVGMVFQHYGLWPHMNALDTVAYPLERAGIDRTAARRQARELLDLLRISDLAERTPARLSGGEQQRVGLARALARRPALYLLDEPTAHLDTVLKADLQAELSSRMRADGAAAVHATHDVEEALAVADRVALLRDGRLIQIDSSETVYARPADDWAARMTGPASFVDGDIRAEGGTGEGRYLVRPDWVRFDGDMPANVLDVRYRGTHTDYRLATPVGELSVRQPGPASHAIGEETTCAIDRVWRMPATS